MDNRGYGITDILLATVVCVAVILLGIVIVERPEKKPPILNQTGRAEGTVLAGELPVKNPGVAPPGYAERSAGIRNPITFGQIHNIVGGDSKGLNLDLGDAHYFGAVFSGPYPFEEHEADYDYVRYRKVEELKEGVGRIRLDKFFQDKYNSNNWDREMGGPWTAAYRIELYKWKEGDNPARLGFYDSIVSFKQGPDGVFKKNLTIVEGPFVALLTSDNLGSASIFWETDDESRCSCYVDGSEAASSGPGKKHEVAIAGLSPGNTYAYHVQCRSETNGDSITTREYTFQAAPHKKTLSHIRFAFTSDSREGVGGGEQNYMGSNFYILNRIAMDAYRKGARFMIFGGDLVNGYTSETEDFELQLRGWKQALAGFLRSNAIYPTMGNHETLLNVFEDGSKYGLSLDKWPYETDSAEAVFAREFVNPENGPTPSDSRRPAYRENVFSFQYGPVLCIGYNNNYWWTTNNQVENFGGSPEGYIMEDQLKWIEKELERAEKDPTIKYILLYAQEPVFPCGGHVKDSMWWQGNNNYRAYTYTDGKLIAAKMGMIEVRNRFWQAVASSSKVAAVLAGDEHEYHRLLVDKQTPVGIMADDKNGDGVIDWDGDEPASPNLDYTHPVWQITAGTAGAPYYSREKTPWEPELLSSQAGYCMFEASDSKISMTFYSITGQVVDHIDNLMDVKIQKHF